MKGNIEENILNRIKNGELRMKPRWWFRGKMLGIKLAYWLVVLMASVGAATIFYFFDLYRPNELWEWWQLSPNLMTEDFPFWSTIGFVGCILLGVIILSNIGENYKKANKFWLLTTTLIIMFVGMVFFLLKIRI